MTMDLEQEPLPSGRESLLAVGTKAPPFEFQLTTGQTLAIEQLHNRGFVLLNFIKGTWCPFCQAHLANLRAWQNSLSHSASTIVVVSNDPLDAIRNWTRDNPITYLFGSATNPSQTFQDYGVRATGQAFARPATFLIEKGGKIRMAYDGVRGKSLELECENCGILTPENKL